MLFQQQHLLALIFSIALICFFPFNGKSQPYCSGIFQEVNSSIIPNHSFESINGCPQDYSQMHFANNWIQASNPTSDLLHFCGSNPYMSGLPTVPLPIPDGNGIVGMYNWYDDAWVEYVGTCTSVPMEAFKEYTLRFHVGFGTGGFIGVPSSLGISLFGNQNCNALPFNGNFCPIQADPSWIELAKATVSGNNEWVEVVFQFTPTVDIESIVLGPSCEYQADQGYIFMDELILTETANLLLEPSIDISGELCQDQLVLSASPVSNEYQYNWFHNGNLISGANGSTYNIPSGQEGYYHVRLTAQDGNGCEESPLIEIVLPLLQSTQEVILCYGETIEVVGQTITSSGEYFFETQNAFGCDSTISIVVNIQPEIEITFEASDILCAGDSSQVSIETISGDNLSISWEDGSSSFSRELFAGEYSMTITDNEGCTQTNQIQINEPPILEGNVTYADITCIGDDNGWVRIEPTGGVGDYKIYFSEYPFALGDSMTYMLLEPNDYYVTVIDENGCRFEEVVTLVEPEDPLLEIIYEELEMTLGNTQEVRVKSSGSTYLQEFCWEPEVLMNCKDCPIGNFTPDQIGAHQLTLTAFDENDCSYRDSIEVIVTDGVAIPNAFSPNGDGNNDYFYVMGQGVQTVHQMSIFSRNGAEVFTTKNTSANEEGSGWDGTFRGKELDTNVFVYLIELELLDGKRLSFSGDVTLIR